VQRGLAQSAQNVANAETPGYARRDVQLREGINSGASSPIYREGMTFGGVEAASVTRAWDAYRAADSRYAASAAGRADVRQQWLSSVETALDDGDAGVGATFTSGRSTIGGGYDPATMRAPNSHGAAGPAPGNPSGPALNFGRYAGWTIGEIGRTDPAYLEWLERTPIGRPFREAIDDFLRRAGRRRSPADEAHERHGLFRRR